MNISKTKIITLMISCGIFATSCSSDKNIQPTEENAATNAVIENIMTRKSVRQFTSAPIAKDTIEILLKAGMAAPSAINKQPWKFIVLQDKLKLQEIADTMPNSRTATAPMAIVVCGDMTKKIEGPAGDFWIQDCSAATENILLAAHSLGLGAVWTGVYPAEGRAELVREILDIESRYAPLCIIPIGYPAEDPTPKDKWIPDNVIWK